MKWLGRVPQNRQDILREDFLYSCCGFNKKGALWRIVLEYDL